MRIMLTTWQLSRCPLLWRGGQVRVLQKVLNRFNGHRLQWYFGQRLSHIFSFLNEIGDFAKKSNFGTKLPTWSSSPSGISFVAFLTWYQVYQMFFLFNFGNRLSRPSSTYTRKQVPKEGRSTWVCRRRRGRACWRRCAMSRSPGCQGQSSETWVRERSMSENIKGTMFGDKSQTILLVMWHTSMDSGHGWKTRKRTFHGF